MNQSANHGRGLTRRGVLGASAALAATWTAGTQLGLAPAAHATDSETFDQQVSRLRSQFFTGPILDHLDLDTLDPARRPDSTQLGIIGHFQFADRYPWITPENMLPFVVAAGIKWVRTGVDYEHWDWAANQPTPLLRHWVESDRQVGVKPLFTINNNANIGTDKEISGWVDMTRALITQWGVDVGAFMFGNEPGNGLWKRTYGGTYAGGPWVEPYTRFVEEGARQIKGDHPDAFLVNGIQVEQMAMTQLKRSAPLIDALCMHHYTYRHALPPEYNPRTADPKFEDFATSDPEFERTMHDYLRQGRMLLRNPDLQLWMTEAGIPSLSHREFEPDSLEPMSRSQQAKTLARMLILGFMSVTKTFVYTLADQGHSPGRDNDNYGLVADDVTPKPAYFTVGRISALTGGRAVPDPDFLAVLTRIDGPTLPTHVKRVGSPVTRLMKEQLRAERFTTADGRGLVAIWSTAPTREQFTPRRATFAVNKSVGTRPIVVDPLTGSSRVLPTHPGPAGHQTFSLEVTDYPQLILDCS